MLINLTQDNAVINSEDISSIRPIDHITIVHEIKLKLPMLHNNFLHHPDLKTVIIMKNNSVIFSKYTVQELWDAINNFK